MKIIAERIRAWIVMSVAFILQKFWHMHFWYHYRISFTISSVLFQFQRAKFTMHFHFSLPKFTVLFQYLFAWKQCNAMLKLITRTARNNFLTTFWDCQNEVYCRENTSLNCHERCFHFTKILAYEFLISL